MTCMPYKSAFERPDSPLRNIRLPARMPHHFLAVFRLVHGPPDSWVCMKWQFLVPFPMPAPLSHREPYGDVIAPYHKALNDDPGVRAMLEGKCSHCGLLAGQLYFCKGCTQHTYCGKPCQRSAWKEHKVLCKQAQAYIALAI